MSILLLVKIAVVLPVMLSALPGTLCIWNWLAKATGKNRFALGSKNADTQSSPARRLIITSELPKIAASDF